MNESEYLERATVSGSFTSKKNCERWRAEKLREGFSVSPAIKNPFPFSNEKPWEATATAAFTIEARWS